MVKSRAISKQCADGLFTIVDISVIHTNSDRIHWIVTI